METDVQICGMSCIDYASASIELTRKRRRRYALGAPPGFKAFECTVLTIHLERVRTCCCAGPADKQDSFDVCFSLGTGSKYFGLPEARYSARPDGVVIFEDGRCGSGLRMHVLELIHCTCLIKLDVTKTISNAITCEHVFRGLVYLDLFPGWPVQATYSCVWGDYAGGVDGYPSGAIDGGHVVGMDEAIKQMFPGNSETQNSFLRDMTDLAQRVNLHLPQDKEIADNGKRMETIGELNKACSCLVNVVNC
jgi:hypothetical protein